MRQVSRQWTYPPFLLVVAVAVLPVVLAPRLLDIRSGMVYAGGIVWAISVAFKGYFYQPFLCSFPQKSLNVWSVSVLSGVYSAAMELGPAALYFAVKDLSSAEALGFGLGAGSFEAGFLALVMLKSLREPHAEPAGWVKYATPIERSIATLGHTGMRGLVYLGVMHRGVVWPLAAMCIFGFFDGVANYGKRVGWNWSDSRVLGRYYSALFLLATVAMGLFLLHF
jgi:hypothetical protein